MHSPQRPCLPSFPTRRSSDLLDGAAREQIGRAQRAAEDFCLFGAGGGKQRQRCLQGLPVPFAAIAVVEGQAEKGAVRMLHIERSEEHTSELQSRGHLVCRLLL